MAKKKAKASREALLCSILREYGNVCCQIDAFRFSEDFAGLGYESRYRFWQECFNARKTIEKVLAKMLLERFGEDECKPKR